MSRFFRRKDLRSLVKLILFIIAASLIIISCQDDPSPVGADQLPDEDKFKFDTLNTQITPIIQNSSFFIDSVDLGASERVFLGKTNDIKSTLLLRFLMLLPDSVAVEVDSGNINLLESWVELLPISTLGDNSSNFDFTVHEIQEEWLPADFGVDELNALSVGLDDISGINAISDTLISFPVDTALVNSWMITRLENPATTNFGLVVKPTDNTDHIKMFEGIANTATQLPTLKIIVEKPGSFTDTLDMPINADVHVPEIELPVVNDDTIILQGGLAARGKIFFDLEGVIPQNASANSARLELSIDTLSSRFPTSGADRINYNMLSASDTTNTDLATQFGTLQLRKEGSKYVDDSFIQFLNRWLNGEENKGLVFSIDDENSSLSQIKIYGSSADPTLRPKLIVTYSF
jgi:hypothetical protein